MVPRVFEPLKFYYISSNVDKANVFNDYFISQCQLNDENTPLPDMNIPNDISVLENIVLTPDEVKDTLQSLKLGKASGPDGINNRALKELAVELASPLCTLFNFSLSNSAVPTCWKEANVTPFFKTDDPSNGCGVMLRKRIVDARPTSRQPAADIHHFNYQIFPSENLVKNRISCFIVKALKYFFIILFSNKLVLIRQMKDTTVAPICFCGNISIEMIFVSKQ